jgi:high-affinity Fe2+/Pb2+ permease
MPRAQAGVAAAVASTSRQLGSTLGVAVIGAVLASGIGSSPYRGSFVSAARPGWWILAGCGLAVLVLGLLSSGRWARRTAERTAASLETAEIRPVVETASKGA